LPLVGNTRCGKILKIDFGNDMDKSSVRKNACTLAYTETYLNKRAFLQASEMKEHRKVQKTLIGSMQTESGV